MMRADPQASLVERLGVRAISEHRWTPLLAKELDIATISADHHELEAPAGQPAEHDAPDPA